MDPKSMRKLRQEFGIKKLPTTEISRASSDRKTPDKEIDFYCQTTPLKANIEIREERKSEARPSSAKAGRTKKDSMTVEVSGWNHLNL